MVIVEYAELPDFLKEKFLKKQVHKVQRRGKQYIVHLKEDEKQIWRQRKSGWCLDNQTSG